MSADKVFTTAAAPSSMCAADEPLVPPSPYKPGAYRVRPRPSTLPSLFANKMGILTAQDTAYTKDKEAVREVEKMMERRTTPFQKRAASAPPAEAESPEPEGSALAKTQDEPVETELDPASKAKEESLQITLFFVVKCRQVEEEEREERERLIAEEEHDSLQMETDFLDGRQDHLAETLDAEKAEQLAMLLEERMARSEARDSKLRLIEAEVARESLERRVGEALRKRIEALFPQYLSERAVIEDDEVEDLRVVFQWHAKNRPLGPGCFIKGPEEDPRIRYGSLAKPRKSTAAQARKIATAKERSLSYRERLRSRASTALVVVDDDTESEMVFAEEGRRLLQDEKLRLHEHIRRTRALEYLIEEEQEERLEIQHEEACSYQPIAAFGVDHLYTVRTLIHEQAMQKQLALEAVKDEDEEDEQALRALIRQQLAQEAADAEAAQAEVLAIEAPIEAA